MKILLLSDTHGWLDPQIVSIAETQDEIWHAGDIGTVEVWETLTGLKPTRIILGNIDAPSTFQGIEATQIWESEGIRFLMHHIAGKPGKYPATVQKLIRKHEPQVLICGHSHIPLVTKDTSILPLWHLNPGAAGKEGFHLMRTCIQLEVNAGKITQLQLVELGKRGKL